MFLIKNFTVSTTFKKNTALVIWGNNLSSSLGIPKLRKLVRKTVVFTPFYVGVLLGLLISDGGINRSKSNKLMRIGFVQSFTEHFHYFMYVYFSFSFIFRSLPYLRIQFKKGIQTEKMYLFQ
jgi:hypothetical protein